VAKESAPPQRRREQILEIAARLFQKGFRATSLDHVAAEMGVTRPALYYYFRSKEDLLAAIYDRAVGVLIDRAAALFAEELPPEALLRKLIEVHVRTMLQEHSIVRVYFQEKDSLGDAASRAVKAKEVAFTKMMASTIEAGQKAKIFRPGDPQLIVNAILGMLIWVHAWYRPDRHAEKDISDVFWRLLAGGLLISPTRASGELGSKKQRATVGKTVARVASKRALNGRRAAH
jgi:TetR/AcrR family transcriptional regulator, cholesterol catabolism regulator